MRPKNPDKIQTQTPKPQYSDKLHTIQTNPDISQNPDIIGVPTLSIVPNTKHEQYFQGKMSRNLHIYQNLQ